MLSALPPFPPPSLLLFLTFLNRKMLQAPCLTFCFLALALESTTDQEALVPFTGELCSEIKMRALGALADPGMSLLLDSCVHTYRNTHF